MFIHKYTVIAVDNITPSTILLTLKSAAPGSSFTFQPGQYAAFSFIRKHRPSPARCFSIVSSPTQQDVLQFSMRSKGHFTRAVAKLSPGDRVDVRGPFGGFVLDTARDANVVLLAGGIGITPFLSMIRFATTIQAKNRITLIYSCRDQTDIPFRDELIELEKKNPNLTVTFVISSGPTDLLKGKRVVAGFVTRECIDTAISRTHTGKTFFICGPPPFMNAQIKTLKVMGVGHDAIKTEAFSQGSGHQTGRIQSWPYNMYAMSAMGLTLGGLAVMASDLMKTLPPTQLVNAGSPGSTSVLLMGSRQQELDVLVNNLPAQAATAPASTAVKKALAEQAAAQAAVDAANQQTTTQPQSQTPTQPQTTTPAPTTVTPAVPAPVCTTSPSGVQTCN